MKTFPPPPELLEQRPGLANEPDVYHPATDPRLGQPPRKYTRAVHERICDELKKGQRIQGACAMAGITTATFYSWMKQGKEGNPWLTEFVDDVECAFNMAEAIAVGVVTEGFHSVDPETRAKSREDAKWFLERARADGFSKQVKTAVEGQIQEFMKRLERSLEPEVFMKVLSVYLGQAPAAEFEVQEVKQLPAHDSSEEADSAEEFG